MGHTIPELLKLTGKYNKPVMQRKSNKAFGYTKGRNPTAWIGIDGKILDKPIQIYRLWYRFLQLALELEQKNVTIITREIRVPYPKPKMDSYGHMRKSYLKPVKFKVKVDKKKYAEWDLNKIPTTEFNDWWKTHREMFFDESTQLLDSKNDWVDNSNFAYIRIDKRKRANDILVEIRRLLDKSTFGKTKSLSKYPVRGTPNISTLVNRYNAFLLKVTTEKTDEQIFEAEAFRTTQDGMKKGYKIGEAGYGRVMRDLIIPAKQTLLSVCDGYFVQHPVKKYMGDDKEKMDKQVAEVVKRATKGVKPIKVTKVKKKAKPKKKAS